MNDPTVTNELDAIARLLEGLNGTVTTPALKLDKEVVARLRRIREALGPLLNGILLSLEELGAPVKRTVTFDVQDPENIKTHAGRGTKSFPAWLNDSGFNLRISKIYAISDADNYAFTLFKSASASDISIGGSVQLAAVTCSSDGTQGFFADLSSFDNDLLETGKWLIFQHSSGSAEALAVTVEGFYEAP